MKRGRVLFGVVAVIIGSVLVGCMPLLLLAAEFQAGNQVTVASGVTTTDDLYAAGGNISVANTIQGDLYAAGGTILVNGSVTQDLAAAGGTVTILGNVGDDARLAGGTITLGGNVGDDVLAGGGQVTLSGTGIGGDVSVGGGSVRIEAPVRGSAKIGGGDVFLNSPIAGSVEVESDALTLGSKTVIEGDLTYRGPKEAVIEEGAVVRGKINYEPHVRGEKGEAAARSIVTVFKLGEFLMLLTGALVLGLLFRRYTGQMVQRVYEKSLPELGRGFAALFLIPIAAIILSVTVIGIPLGLLTLLGYIALLIFAWFMAPVLLGSFLYRWIGKNKTLEVSWLTILLGVVVYIILGLIPIVGWLAQCIILLITLGAAIRMKWDIVKAWR